MPLIQSPSRAAIGSNIRTEETVGGRPHRQAVAIALSEARKNGAKIPPPKGGTPSGPMLGQRRSYIAAPDRRM